MRHVRRVCIAWSIPVLFLPLGIFLDSRPLRIVGAWSLCGALLCWGAFLYAFRQPDKDASTYTVELTRKTGMLWNWRLKRDGAIIEGSRFSDAGGRHQAWVTQFITLVVAGHFRQHDLIARDVKYKGRRASQVEVSLSRGRPNGTSGTSSFDSQQKSDLSDLPSLPQQYDDSSTRLMCPECEETKLIRTGEYLCDDCLKPRRGLKKLFSRTHP